jgi:hypothetical protein
MEAQSKRHRNHVQADLSEKGEQIDRKEMKQGSKEEPEIRDGSLRERG